MLARLICLINNMKFKRIRSIDQYNNYCEIYEQYLMQDSSKFEDELDLLELLIDDFDNRTIESIGINEDMNPVEILKYLMTENNLNNAELARQLKVSRQLITEILNFKRNISKKMVNKLCKKFRMNPIAFSREYDLILKPKSKMQSV